jgi:hypothetical protein
LLILNTPCDTSDVRSEGRENQRGLRPPFAEQLAAAVAAGRSLWKGAGWLSRVASADGGARAALERLYARGVNSRDVVGLLAGARLSRKAAQLSPTAARRAARDLRGLRRILEDVEAARPFEVMFQARAGATERGATTWSLASYMTRWVPEYLDACASGKVRGLVAVEGGRPADRVMQRCAQELARLGADPAEIGALLFAAFPRRFHAGTAEDDDHSEAARALLRRAAKNVPANTPATPPTSPHSSARQPGAKKKAPR